MNLFKSILALFLLLPLFSLGQINNHAANGSQAPDPDEFSWEMYSYQGGNWQVVKQSCLFNSFLFIVLCAFFEIWSTSLF